MALAPYHLSS